MIEGKKLGRILNLFIDEHRNKKDLHVCICFRNIFYGKNLCVIQRVPKENKLLKAVSSKINALALWMIKQNQNDRKNEDQITTLRF